MLVLFETGATNLQGGGGVTSTTALFVQNYDEIRHRKTGISLFNKQINMDTHRD
jgi:hypothetical protein